jgi:hypothetical protein
MRALYRYRYRLLCWPNLKRHDDVGIHCLQSHYYFLALSQVHSAHELIIPPSSHTHARTMSIAEASSIAEVVRILDAKKQAKAERRKLLRAHLEEINAQYASIDPKMKTFVDLYYEKKPYSQFSQTFQERWNRDHKGEDGRMTMWTTHIREFLDTRMEWPDGHSCLVSDLPADDKDILVDYLGFQIGLGRGQGNTALVDVFKKHFA